VVMEDGVKKVSVINVICASKGCTADTARNIYARLLKARSVLPRREFRAKEASKNAAVGGLCAKCALAMRPYGEASGRSGCAAF
jgi:hypothetical protein